MTLRDSHFQPYLGIYEQREVESDGAAYSTSLPGGRSGTKTIQSRVLSSATFELCLQGEASLYIEKEFFTEQDNHIICKYKHHTPKSDIHAFFIIWYYIM